MMSAADAPTAQVPPAPVPPAPQRVVPAPLPAERVVPITAATPAPVMCRVSFAAESLFGFDKPNMRPEGTTALDTVRA